MIVVVVALYCTSKTHRTVPSKLSSLPYLLGLVVVSCLISSYRIVIFIYDLILSHIRKHRILAFVRTEARTPSPLPITFRSLYFSKALQNALSWNVRYDVVFLLHWHYGKVMKTRQDETTEKTQGDKDTTRPGRARLQKPRQDKANKTKQDRTAHSTVARKGEVERRG